MKICMNATTVTQKENYFSVATNCTEIRNLLSYRSHHPYQSRI